MTLFSKLINKILEPVPTYIDYSECVDETILLEINNGDIIIPHAVKSICMKIDDELVYIPDDKLQDIIKEVTDVQYEILKKRITEVLRDRETSEKYR